MQASTQLDGLRILVVEDSPAIQATVCYVLSQAGYEVHLADTGLQALGKQRANPFPLVITDIAMPDMDGLELIQAIHREFPKTRLIAMTGGGAMDIKLTLKIATQFGSGKVLSTAVPTCT